MPYSPIMVRPMKEELAVLGFSQLLTPEDVESFMEESRGGSALVVINSVCGCAAGQARPGVRMALEADGPLPDRLGTVFAGQEVEATQKMRSYFPDVPPSSPSMALFKDGELTYFIPRHKIENRTAQQVAEDLQGAFRRFLAAPVAQ